MEHAENLGAYAIGALDPAEARTVRWHLAQCPDCRRQLEELAEVKDVLERVPLQALLDASPDGGQLLRRVAAEEDGAQTGQAEGAAGS